MKTILPWLCAAILAAGLAFAMMSNQKQAAELQQRRAESQELESLKAAAEEAKSTQSQSEGAELARLREDNKDLLKLRNEVQKLRSEKEQLSKQVQTSQAQAQAAQAQAQNAQAQFQTAQQQAQTAQAQAAALRLNAAPEARQGVCINNLRQIDGAKQQWALENGRTADATPAVEEVAKYLAGTRLPICPGGGAYTLNAVNVKPMCNVPGHVLQ